VLVVDKNRPSPEWIAELRKRYPCEREIDRILTRKLTRRAGPPYTPVPLTRLVEGGQALLRSRIGDDFVLSQARWLSGGASKLQVAFELEWKQLGAERQRASLVLRMEPSESISETSRLREFEVINALEGTLPVPRSYWIDAEAEFLPYPAIVYGLVRGVAKPTRSSSHVSGLGTYMPPELRGPLGADFVGYLARLHAFEWRGRGLNAFDPPQPGTEAVEKNLNHWARVWEEDVHEDVPLVRLALGWLRNNMPPIDHVSLVHGDYRVGNFLFDEDTARITAWLDWELALLGDRHEDLSWAAKTIFGHNAQDGKTFLVGGFMPVEEFFVTYEKLSGLSVDPKILKYYEILNNFKAVTIALATGYRAPSNGKTHQDVLVSWLSGVSYSILEELRAQLEEVL